MENKDLEFISALKDIYDTPAGKIVFERLTEDYVRPSALSKDPVTTYYVLSRKELILELLDLIKIPEEELKETSVTMEI